MKQIVTAEEMRTYEGYLMETLGIPSLLLMERAAGYIKDAAVDLLGKGTGKKVLIVAGNGNNGADGLAAARMLCEEGYDISTVIPVESDRCSEKLILHKEILKKMGIGSKNKLSEALETVPDLIIDAVLGIGLNRDLRGAYLDVVRKINEYREGHKDCYVLSVDLPSGLHTDLGRPLPESVKADVTVTFGYPKRGMYLMEGRRYCGNTICQPIGPDRGEAQDYRMDWEDIAGMRPKRDPLGHKGTFGKVLYISGCKDMPGAAILNASSVLKSGAGMVKVLSVSQNRDLLMQTIPEAMFCAMDEIDDTALENELQWADTVLLGSGLSKERAKAFLQSKALALCEKSMILDADGLNALADDISFLKNRKEKGLVTYLTPHPGEFKRLFPEMECQNPDDLRKISAEYGVVLVAKSATTLVTDGIKVYYNSLGSDALATAGSGDVLAGILAAVSCVIRAPLNAAIYADAVHAKAGDAAAGEIGKSGVTATDIIRMLPLIIEDEK